MTAFYMFRLMSMTFFGDYRGPAWEHGQARRARATARTPARPRAAAAGTAQADGTARTSRRSR